MTGCLSNYSKPQSRSGEHYSKTTGRQFPFSTLLLGYIRDTHSASKAIHGIWAARAADLHNGTCIHVAQKLLLASFEDAYGCVRSRSYIEHLSVFWLALESGLRDAAGA